MINAPPLLTTGQHIHRLMRKWDPFLIKKRRMKHAYDKSSWNFENNSWGLPKKSALPQSNMIKQVNKKKISWSNFSPYVRSPCSTTLICHGIISNTEISVLSSIFAQYRMYMVYRRLVARKVSNIILGRFNANSCTVRVLFLAQV